MTYGRECSDMSFRDRLSRFCSGGDTNLNILSGTRPVRYPSLTGVCCVVKDAQRMNEPGIGFAAAIGRTTNQWVARYQNRIRSHFAVCRTVLCRRRALTAASNGSIEDDQSKPPICYPRQRSRNHSRSFTVPLPCFFPLCL